jgi:EAL domain-containing protein (putative c-di-GMP-specific phosphodiesterase class I)
MSAKPAKNLRPLAISALMDLARGPITWGRAAPAKSGKRPRLVWARRHDSYHDLTLIVPGSAHSLTTLKALCERGLAAWTHMHSVPGQHIILEITEAGLAAIKPLRAQPLDVALDAPLGAWAPPCL